MIKVLKILLTAVMLLSSVASVAELNHCLPTPSRKVTSPFGARWGRQHKGVDVKVQMGDTIRTAFDGEVVKSKYNARGYGYYVVVRHAKGVETLYGHLSKRLVEEGMQIQAGTPIGLGGNTGRVTGIHLHFEVHIDGKAVDPLTMFDFANQQISFEHQEDSSEYQHITPDHHSSDLAQSTVEKKTSRKERKLAKRNKEAQAKQPDSLGVRTNRQLNLFPAIVCGQGRAEASPLASLTVIILNLAKGNGKLTWLPLSSNTYLRPSKVLSAMIANNHDSSSSFNVTVEVIQPPPQPPEVFAGSS